MEMSEDKKSLYYKIQGAYIIKFWQKYCQSKNKTKCQIAIQIKASVIKDRVKLYAHKICAQKNYIN